MPLRDHFHAPLENRRRWEGVHGQWPGVIVQYLNDRLPAHYYAEPHVHQDLYEVQVYDERRGSRLVAAVELVSPANKDRPDSRRAFAVKCASHLQQRVCVLIVDLVTDRKQSVFAEMMELLGLSDPFLEPEPPLYAVSCRTTKHGEAWRMDTWSEPLTVGAALPTLPLWLASDLAVPLDLEETYETTCRVLRIS